jgi:hypothetical protein
MEEFPVAGSTDDPQEALTLLRATAIASFGEAVRQIARNNFHYCHVHRRASVRVDGDPETSRANICVCPVLSPAADAAPSPVEA